MLFVNHRDAQGSWGAAFGVDWLWRFAQEFCEFFDARLPAWRATIDIGRTFRERLGVWPASIKPAFGALRLRQQLVYSLNKGFARHGLPVILNGERARVAASARCETLLLEQSAHLSDHIRVTAEHDPRLLRVQRLAGNAL